MEQYQYTYKTYQLKLQVDVEKKSIQINVVNPADPGHSAAKVYKINDDTPVANQAQVIAAVESWDQLDAAIESAEKIFKNLPVIPE
jgi:hypothetical protein